MSTVQQTWLIQKLVLLLWINKRDGLYCIGCLKAWKSLNFFYIKKNLASQSFQHSLSELFERDLLIAWTFFKKSSLSLQLWQIRKEKENNAAWFLCLPVPWNVFLLFCSRSAVITTLFLLPLLLGCHRMTPYGAHRK